MKKIAWKNRNVSVQDSPSLKGWQNLKKNFDGVVVEVRKETLIKYDS